MGFTSCGLMDWMRMMNALLYSDKISRYRYEEGKVYLRGGVELFLYY